MKDVLDTDRSILPLMDIELFPVLGYYKKKKKHYYGYINF